MMNPRIETIEDKKLIGKSMRMSLAENKTAELWRGFMPRRREIITKLTEDLISLQVYKPAYFDEFNPQNEFVKWASVEVSSFENMPAGLEKYILRGGLYAVFDYKGPSNDNSIFQHIYGTWIPYSDYILDDRPHFEVLGRNYKNAGPNSEEEIWIPIKSQ